MALLLFMIGPAESLIILFMVVGYLLPIVASAVLLWLVFQGRFSAPKSCPKCGAENRRTEID